MNARWLPALVPVIALATAAFSAVHASRTVDGSAVAPQVSTASASPVQYARYFFSTDNVNSAATQAARWPLLIGQGNQVAGAKRVKAADPTHVRTQVYADPLYIRQSDPEGVTTATRNATTMADHPEWILRDSSGAKIQATDFRNQDYAADIGNRSYQQASVTFLLNKIKNDGWNGVFLDDTNPTPLYTFSARPAKYPTDASWQAAELSYIKAVCTPLRAAGKNCYLNLGEQNTTWAESVAALSTGPMSEFFVAMDPSVGGAPSLASYENGRWRPQMHWVQWAEANTIQEVVHASTSNGHDTDYALTSFLLFTKGRGYFAANRTYTSALDSPFTTAMTNARRLGAASGAAHADASGVYYRDFANGRVVVNPHDTTRIFGGRVYLPTTGSLTLR